MSLIRFDFYLKTEIRKESGEQLANWWVTTDKNRSKEDSSRKSLLKKHRCQTGWEESTGDSKS